MNSKYTWIVFLFDAIAIIAFIFLAVVFKHWWIALFSYLFFLIPKYKQESDEHEK